MPRRFHTDGSGHLHDHAWKIGVGPDGMAEEIGLLNDLSSQVERLTAVVEAAKEYRAHLDRLEAEVVRLQSDREGWAARSLDQFNRIGAALGPIREARYSGEPSRDDATEIEFLVTEVARLRAATRWIPVAERLPLAGIPVLATYINEYGKRRRVRAMYATRHTLEQADECDGGEYDAETDMYWCRPGWYENNEHEEVNWRIDEEVTHWLPLPSIDALEVGP